VVSIYSVLLPLLSSLASVFILTTETFTLRDALACAIIIAGMIVFNYNEALKNAVKKALCSWRTKNSEGTYIWYTIFSDHLQDLQNSHNQTLILQNMKELKI
jgi:hypothetical protein